MKKFYPLTIVLAIVTLISCKKDEFDPHKINEFDLQFMKELSMANRAEISKGQLAASRSNHPSVQSFSQIIISNHQALQADLVNLASTLGIELPTVVSNDQEELLLRLSDYSGYSFDTAYMSSEVKNHQQILSVIQVEYNEGNHYGVRAFVNRHFEKFQYHYVKADSVRREL